MALSKIESNSCPIIGRLMVAIFDGKASDVNLIDGCPTSKEALRDRQVLVVDESSKQSNECWTRRVA
jgi:hypothetical protein